MKELSFKIKIDGKFSTLARYGNNKFDNLQLSVHRPTLIAMLKGEGDWVNVSVFEDDGKPKAESQKQSAVPFDEDSIPF